MPATGRSRTAAALAAVLLAGSCRVPDTDYFPVGGGRSWDYEIRRVIKGEEHRQRLLLASLPTVVIDGNEYFPQARLDDRLDLFTRANGAIVRVNYGERPLPLPVLPAELKPGVKWQAPGRILFLDVTGAFQATFHERRKQSIDLEYEIESMDDTAEVAAGRFDHCMRIRSHGSMYAGATLKEFLGINFIQIDQTEWYAPGVGLVKRVRKESTTPADWNNDFEQQLVALN
jgi:hypothetical protein